MVILGIRRPFPAPEISSIEEGSGGLAVVLILTWLPRVDRKRKEREKR